MFIPYDVPVFTILGDFTARITSMHDGDTFTCVFFYSGRFHKFHARINGIDTPEMASKDPRAFEARHRLFQLLTGTSTVLTQEWKKKDFDDYFSKNYTEVPITCTGLDKYGRLLVNSGTITDTLIREELAHSYQGQTKKTWN